MKPATLYTAATVLLLAIVLAAIAALKPNDEGLKAKAEARATALEEAATLLMAR